MCMAFRVVCKPFPVARTLLHVRGNLFRIIREPFRVVADDVRPLARAARGLSCETSVDSWERPQMVGTRPVDRSGDRAKRNA
jgi:hypothetical protein